MERDILKNAYFTVPRGRHGHDSCLSGEPYCAERRTYGSEVRSREIAYHYALLLTLLPTAQGWLYLAVVLDLFSRAVVGWALADRMTGAIVRQALTMALGRRGEVQGLLLHSDRGSQYAAADYQRLLRAHGITPARCRARATVMTMRRWRVSSAHSNEHSFITRPIQQGQRPGSHSLSILKSFIFTSASIRRATTRLR